MKPKWIALIALAILILVIISQNTQVVEIRLLFWALRMSQIVLVPLVLAVGFAAGYLVAKIGSSRNKDEI
ncbi:MAG: LapA family protein [bacterium]|nr:LapA family protein [bacterium]